MTRLFYCTDLHGSEICFRKFLSAGKVYEADTVLMGGDCTGKMVIPIIDRATATGSCSWSGGDVELRGEQELAELETQIKNNGLYPVRMTAEEREALAGDSDRLASLFERVMVETLTAWLALAEERLGDSGLQVIVTPGQRRRALGRRGDRELELRGGGRGQDRPDRGSPRDAQPRLVQRDPVGHAARMPRGRAGREDRRTRRPDRGHGQRDLQHPRAPLRDRTGRRARSSRTRRPSSEAARS